MDFADVKKMKQRDSKRIYLISMGITIVIVFLLEMMIFDIGKVSGNSMYPTLKDGDIEVSIRIKYSGYQKGDIVNIDSVSTRESIVKRIIATSGDTVEIKSDGIYVNGKQLKESYLAENPDYKDSIGYIVTVPNGHIFVLGDNRNNSADSRIIGCISEAEIRSKVLFTFK